MISIAFEIVFNWIIMGITIACLMAGCLYFAKFCEKIVDFLFSR